ncbi:MAG TPA: ABC transporter permease [Chitinophagaceae bacterium]|jgi:putative ABC transport system permease protein|nr:ABC transporter permease [Chitinophagaceae bacterium]
MIKNYLKIAVRNLLRYKGFSFINIFGLATGMACSLLIFLFVKDEMSYDRFHKDSDKIYRVVKDFVNDDGSRLPDATTPPALSPAMQREIPEVLHATRVFPNWGANFLIKYGDKKIMEEKLCRVDSSFFDVFTFPFIHGSAKDAFRELNSIVITESAAKRYFGNENPMGKTLQIDPLGDLMVKGVVKDVPYNSHFHFDFLISTRKFSGNIDGDWDWYNFYTYVKLKSPADIASLDKKIQDLYKRNNKDGKNIFYAQPLAGIHLSSNLKWELEPNSDKLYVYVFTIIAIFIILIAGINYVNLSTAKASVRAKEVGVRKVAGAFRSSLVNQFLIESIITCLIASALAVLIAQLLLPVVNNLTLKNLTVIGNPSVLLYMVMAALFLGVVAGFFPAVYLSSFKPILVLKGLKFSEKGTLNLRKALVIVQFTISTVLIIGALIISQQMHFIQSAKLGLDKDQVVVIKNAYYLSRTDGDAFQNLALQIPGVKKIATSDGVVGGQNWTNGMRLKGSQNSQLMNFLSVSYDFLDALGIQIKEGRNFSSTFPADTMNNGIPKGPLDQNIGSVILNETAVKDLGIPEPAVGKQIVWGNDGDTTYYVSVVGVAKDFHFTSFRNQIKPFAFVNIPRRVSNFTIKLSTDNIKQTLTQLESTWKKLSADKPFEYNFLDETYAGLYQSETRFQKVFISLVVLGIIIACLGLFGLATFAAQQRVKEIGIRKVLGASVSNLIGLLSKDFLKLVIIALILAVPVAWFAMSKWLQDFAYRINIQWWVFMVGAIITILIAWITISTQAFKAAAANPVKSLRTE